MSNARMPVPTVNGFPLPDALRSEYEDIRLEALELQRQLIGASSAETPQAARIRVRLHLRAVRPIRQRVMLKEGLRYERDTGVEYDANPIEGYIGWVPDGGGMSVSSHFMHRSVAAWLQSIGLPREKYALLVDMGVYEHEDIITLALDVRRFQRLRDDLRVGSELSPEEFETFSIHLKLYAHWVDGTASARHHSTFPLA